MTKRPGKIIPSKIHLRGVTVFKSHIESSAAYMDQLEELEVELFDFGASVQSAFHYDEELIRLRLFVSLNGKDASDKAVGLDAEFGVEFNYEVDNLDDFVVKEDDDVKVMSILGATLIGISYSTARGIILERMQGTYFDGVLLPIIDPNDLLKPEVSNQKIAMK